MTDPVSEKMIQDAIAATETPQPPPAPTYPTLKIDVTISTTQRMFSVIIPTDMTDTELIDMIGWLGTTLSSHLRAERAKVASRIVLP